MKNEYAQWRKLDNAALAFPAVTGKNDMKEGTEWTGRTATSTSYIPT